MSDEDDLVVVDTADGMFDSTVEEPLKIESSVNLDPKPNQKQLTYDYNPYGILICSKFKVRSDIEDIPDSFEKRCHFSVEGNEISIKFPLRGEDASTMRDEGARKVIDFIMSLDRVPARLAELMSVPNKQLKRPTPETSVEAIKRRRGKRGGQGGQDKFPGSIHDITTELTNARLPPKFLQVARRVGNNHYKWKVTTLLPEVEMEFVGLEETNLSAKLTSLVKAAAFAKAHNLGGFAPLFEPTKDNLYFQNEHSFRARRYPRQSNFHRPQQRHVSVHSRLAPPVTISPRYFEDNYPPPPEELDLAPPGPFYEYYEDAHELEYPAYPTPFFPHAPRVPRYMGGVGWRSRGRGRRGQFPSKRGKLFNNESL